VLDVEGWDGSSELDDGFDGWSLRGGCRVVDEVLDQLISEERTELKRGTHLIDKDFQLLASSQLNRHGQYLSLPPRRIPLVLLLSALECPDLLPLAPLHLLARQSSRRWFGILEHCE
jgi:hypothetical protein